MKSLRKSDIAVLILLAYYALKFVPLSSLPFTTPSFEGMTAIAIVENLETNDVAILTNLAELDSQAEARGLDSRQYDDDQEAAVKLLSVTDAKPPVLLIYDGKKVVADFPLPVDFDKLGKPNNE